LGWTWICIQIQIPDSNPDLNLDPKLAAGWTRNGFGSASKRKEDERKRKLCIGKGNGETNRDREKRKREDVKMEEENRKGMRDRSL
jgi:hypothetical protein